MCCSWLALYCVFYSLVFFSVCLSLYLSLLQARGIFFFEKKKLLLRDKLHECILWLYVNLCQIHLTELDIARNWCNKWWNVINCVDYLFNRFLTTFCVKDGSIPNFTISFNIFYLSLFSSFRLFPLPVFWYPIWIESNKWRTFSIQCRMWYWNKEFLWTKKKTFKMGHLRHSGDGGRFNNQYLGT